MIAIGGIIYLFQNLPALSIVLLVLLVIGYFLTKQPDNCQICNCTLKQKKYVWHINGQKKMICPNCNRELERKNSKRAVSKL